METQRLIGKVIRNVTTDDSPVKFTTVAEGMEWDMYSSNNIKIGDFVVCNVLSDEGEDVFYLNDAKLPASNKEEWEKQEKVLNLKGDELQ